MDGYPFAGDVCPPRGQSRKIQKGGFKKNIREAHEKNVGNHHPLTSSDFGGSRGLNGEMKKLFKRRRKTSEREDFGEKKIALAPTSDLWMSTRKEPKGFREKNIKERKGSGKFFWSFNSEGL